MYPVFARLKQLSKAIALAQYIWLNKIPIDLNQVKELVENQQLLNYDPSAPSLKMKKTKEEKKGKTTTTSTMSVFGGVNCQIRLADLIEEDLVHTLSESLLRQDKPIEVEKLVVPTLDP